MIYLNHNSTEPLYKQIYEQLRDGIVEGSMPTDTPLESLRVMEKELDVSRNTVDRAYQQLVAEGYVRSSQGLGYFVEDIESFGINRVTHPSDRSNAEPRPTHPPEVRYDFAYESIQTDLFPWNRWRRYAKEAITREEQKVTIAYESSKGNLELREALRDFLFRHRGVKCTPEQIVICPGTQYAMQSILSLVGPRADRLAYENPGYLAMRYFIEQRGFRVTSVPVLESGIASKILAGTTCNLLYATPSHQFPTGAVMSIGTRNQLLTWAYTNDNTYIIENDYDSEFRHGCLPIPSLQSLDRYQKVIYIGTLSKMMSPTIRCAYLVLPWTLLDRYEQRYRFFNAMLPTYHETAIARMITDGALEKHIRKLSIANDRKYTALLAAMKKHLAGCMEIIHDPAGVHTVVRIPRCADQNALLDDLEKRQIRIYSFAEHCQVKSPAYEDLFIMGYSALAEDGIDEACAALAQALSEIYPRNAGPACRA